MKEESQSVKEFKSESEDERLKKELLEQCGPVEVSDSQVNEVPESPEGGHSEHQEERGVEVDF